MQQHPLSHSQHQVLSQRLVMTYSMQKALKVLELPILELSEWLEEEIQSNPILRSDPKANSGEIPLELQEQTSFNSSLCKQIREKVINQKEIELAEIVIGSLDDRGYLDVPLNQLGALSQVENILTIIQTCEPFGVGARDLKECLLIQLRMQGKENSLSYALVKNGWDNLKKGRLSSLQKKFKIPRETLKKNLKTDLAPLNFHPKKVFDPMTSEHQVADLILQPSEWGWKIDTSEASLPHFELNDYKDYFDGMKEYEREFVRNYAASGQLLIRAIRRRKGTLKMIGELFLKHQIPYLEDNKEIKPMSIEDLACHLNVHESTAFRAISKKWLWCPRGWSPLKAFFSKSPDKQGRLILSYLMQIVREEDKSAPLTDEQLSSKLVESGFKCSRRTVTKYRKKLHIRSAIQRKY